MQCEDLIAIEAVRSRVGLHAAPHAHDLFLGSSPRSAARPCAMDLARSTSALVHGSGRRLTS